MDGIELRGKLKADDVQFSEPDVGTVIFVSGISVPEALENRGFYDATISLRMPNSDKLTLTTYVVVEPAHTNAVGFRRERMLAFSVEPALRAQDLDGADIRLVIVPDKKKSSQALDDFKQRLKTFSRQLLARQQQLR